MIGTSSEANAQLSISRGMTTVDPWQRVLHHLCKTCGGDAAMICVHSLTGGSARILNVVDIAPEMVSQFHQRTASDAPWLSLLATPEAPAVAFSQHDDDIVDDSYASWFRAHWLRPQRLKRFIAGLIYSSPRSAVFVLIAANHRRDAALPSAERLMETLPGLKLAWSTQQALIAQRAEAMTAWQTLDGVRIGVMVLNRAGRVLRLNSAARTIVERGDGLCLHRDRLGCPRSSDAQRLRQMFTEVISGFAENGRPLNRVVAVSRTQSDTPLLVLLVRHTPSPTPLDAIMVYIGDPNVLTINHPEWLQHLYGLSRVDAELAVNIARGLTPEEAAKIMHVSIHTVRAHLKRIFLKTGARRQVELVRLLMAGPAMIALDVGGHDTAAPRNGQSPTKARIP